MDTNYAWFVESRRFREAMARMLNDRDAATQRRLPAFTVSAAARDNPLVRDMYDDEDDEDDGRGAPQVCPPSCSVELVAFATLPPLGSC